MSGIEHALLRYAGGKWRIADWIIGFFGPHDTYVEPFGGAASVLLNKARVRLEIYNDIEDDVVNLMRVMRDDKLFARLRDQLRKTPYSRVEYVEAHKPAKEPVERARRMIVKIQMGWGARSSTGRIHTFGPELSDRWLNYQEQLDKVHERLQGVTIEHRPATEVMLAHDSKETLHYVDPPYLSAPYQQHYKHVLDEQEHTQLLDLLRDLKGMVVLSGYTNPLYNKLLRDWRVFHRVNKSANKTVVTESVWLNRRALDKAPFWL